MIEIANDMLTDDEVSSILGRCLVGLNVSEFGITIDFDNGYSLRVEGNGYDSEIRTNVDWPNKPKPLSARQAYQNQMETMLRKQIAAAISTTPVKVKLSDELIEELQKYACKKKG